MQQYELKQCYHNNLDAPGPESRVGMELDRDMGQGNDPNNNQPRQPVPPQGVPPTSTQDVRNMEEAKNNDQNTAPPSPAHQLNPANTEEQNRAIDAFTQRMRLMQGLPGVENFQRLTVPPRLPAAPDPEEEPNEAAEDDDQEMKSEEKEEKEEKEEREEEDEDESECEAAEGDTTCSICYYPYEQMVPDGQSCDCITTPGNDDEYNYDEEDHQWHKHTCMFCLRKAHWHCWHRHLKMHMNREQAKQAELQAAIDNESIEFPRK